MIVFGKNLINLISLRSMHGEYRSENYFLLFFMIPPVSYNTEKEIFYWQFENLLNYSRSGMLQIIFLVMLQGEYITIVLSLAIH